MIDQTSGKPRSYEITMTNLESEDIAMAIATRLDQGGNAKAVGITITVVETTTATPIWTNQVSGDVDG